MISIVVSSGTLTLSFQPYTRKRIASIFRAYSYDDSKMYLTDFTQWYLELDTANAQRGTDWRISYSFKQAYNLQNYYYLSPRAISQAIQNIQVNML